MPEYFRCVSQNCSHFWQGSIYTMPAETHGAKFDPWLPVAGDWLKDDNQKVVLLIQVLTRPFSPDEEYWVWHKYSSNQGQYSSHPSEEKARIELVRLKELIPCLGMIPIPPWSVAAVWNKFGGWPESPPGPGVHLDRWEEI